MDWAHLRTLVEEVAVWESFFVHSWAILTAIIYLIRRGLRSSGSGVALFLDAAVWALVGLFWTGFAAFVVNLFLPILAPGFNSGLKMVLAAFLVFVLLINAPALMRERLKRP
jgi:hypothetical protein